MLPSVQEIGYRVILLELWSHPVPLARTCKGQKLRARDCEALLCVVLLSGLLFNRGGCKLHAAALKNCLFLHVTSA